jgi:hypothetical protein
MKRLLPLISACLLLLAQAAMGWDSSILYKDGTNRLVYHSDAEGNRIMDFSYAGYKNGNADLPNVTVVHTISPIAGDNTAHIQAAINMVEARTPNANGHRGTLLLNPGTYEVQGALRVDKGGVVIRGSGQGDNPAVDTVIYAAGSSRRAIFTVGTNVENGWGNQVSGTKKDIVSPFVKAGSRTFEVADASVYSVGDNVIIRQYSTDAWLNSVNYGNTAGDVLWNPGEVDLVFNRYITRVEGNTIELDVPIYHDLDRSLSQSYLYVYDRSTIITECGIENLRVEIEYKGEFSLEHAHTSIDFTGVEDCWARNVTSRYHDEYGIHFAQASRCTALDCSSLHAVGPIEGGRRSIFMANMYTSNILFKRCHGTQGRHTFVTNGSGSTAGVVFTQCTSVDDEAGSESHRRWGSAILWDDIDFSSANTGYELGIGYNRGNWGTGHGWTGTGLVGWNVSANHIVIHKGPIGQNYAIACKATVDNQGPWAFPIGFVEGTGQTPAIPSLFEAQLSERLTYGVGPDAPGRLKASHYSNTGTRFVALEWIDYALDETAYVLERSSNGGSSFSELIALPSNTESYSDTTVALNGSYVYRLKAINGIGASAYCNTVAVNLSETKTPPALIYQAEEYRAESGTGIRWDRLDSTGMGYVDLGNSDTWFELEMDGGMGGRVPLTFRYAADGSDPRPCDISVNGEVAMTAPFISTGDWGNWLTETHVVTLARGVNILRVQPAGSNGANMDRVEVPATPMIYAAGEASTDTAAKAFDGNINTLWKHHSPHGSWIQNALGAPLEVIEYSLTSGSGAQANDPKDWKLLGSNDGGATWTTLDTRGGVLFAARKQTQTFSVVSSGNYSLYRLEITVARDIATADSIQLAELGFTYRALPPLAPNPAAFAVAPHAASETSVSMTSVTGYSIVGSVEYYFDEISGNSGGTDSGWISSPTYTDTGLNNADTYSYTVTMRDIPGNETTASVAMSATPYKLTTTVWNGVGASDGQWTTGANWTGGGIAPMTPEQYKKVVFNVSGAKECVLDTAATVAHLVVGDNGASAGVRLSEGAHLVAGIKPGRNAEWTAIGYNQPSQITVESGAVFETAAHLLVGFEGTQSSQINIDGGTVDVATSINLGNSGNTSFGTITVDGGGLLRAGSLSIYNSSSKVDLRNGTLILNGDQVGAINTYIAAGKIVTYGQTGTVDVDYNTINPGKTTIISIPKLEGVLAHWSFDKAAAAGGAYADTSGSGNAIAVSTAPTHVTTGMKFGTGALDFDSSSSQYLTLAGSSGVGAMPLVSNSFSICFWAKRGSMGEHMVAGQGAPASGQGLHVGFRGETHAKPNSPLLAFYANDLEYGAVVADTSDWHHYTMIFNANTMTKKIVIDGNVAGAVEGSSSYFAGGGANDFFIGRHYTGNYFDGLLDEVWVFDDVISDNQIISLYNSNVISTPFSEWADSFLPTDIGSLTNDYDNDSINNLREYALNGDPVDPEDGGVNPILSNIGGQLVYIHLQRNDDPGLVYSVETTTNLVSGDWMRAGDTARGTNVMGGGTFFNEVTNNIPADTDQQFIRLKITNP